MTGSRLLLAMCFLPLLGCPKKSTAGADAAAEAGPVAVVDAGPEASNDAKLTHYKDETPIDHEAAVVKAAKAVALTAVPKGDTAFTLKTGDSVTELSEHNGYFLVLFPDPADGTKKLGGWVPKFAFMDPPAPHNKKVPKCADGQFLVSDKVSPVVPRCTIMCADDSDCPSGKCETAIHLDDKGNPAMSNSVSMSMSVCTVPAVAKDAGAAAPKPAARAVPKCSADQMLFAVTESGPIFCAKDDTCSGDKDCKGTGTCVEAMIMQEDGQPSRNMHGSPIGSNICKPK